MSEEQKQSSEAEGQQEPKKVSLADAVKQRLAQKKQEQAAGNQKQGKFQSTNTKVMKSQQTKKPSNMSKKMGV